MRNDKYILLFKKGRRNSIDIYTQRTGKIGKKRQPTKLTVIFILKFYLNFNPHVLCI